MADTLASAAGNGRKILSVADDLRSKLEESSKLSDIKTAMLSKQIGDLRKNIEQQDNAISGLKEGVNDALGKLQPLALDANKARRDCRPGYVVTGAAAYVEGSVKISFFCSAIPKPQVP